MGGDRSHDEDASRSSAAGGLGASSAGHPTPFDAQTRLRWLALALLSRTDATPEQLTPLLTAETGHTESEIVYRENKLRLHRYTPPERRHETPILVVYALVNRPDILDLQPDRSVIQQLLGAGFEVYLIEWGNPSRLDCSLGLTDYVCRYLDNCVDVICAESGVEELNLLGYCMGGTLATIYTALYESRVRTLGLMATPVAIEETGGILEQWLDHFDPGVVAQTYGNVPAELLAVQFSLLEPVENSLGKYLTLADHVEDEAFLATFARMEQWIWDGVDVTGRAYEEFVTEIYRDNNLIGGEMTVGDSRVDPAKISVPVLQIVGEDDHIVPPAASKPLTDVVDTEDTRVIEFPAGHVGISVSGSAHERLWPEVCEWYGTRSA